MARRSCPPAAMSSANPGSGAMLSKRRMRSAPWQTREIGFVMARGCEKRSTSSVGDLSTIASITFFTRVVMKSWPFNSSAQAARSGAKSAGSTS